MTATLHSLRARKSAIRLKCSSCGASADAACDCGAAYVPAGERAAKAIAESPDRSDRAIAAELGVDHKTVSKARKSTGEHSPVAKRLGRDGKARKPPRPKPKAVDMECPTEAEAHEEHMQHLLEIVRDLIRKMDDETKAKHFAYIRRAYHDHFTN